MHSQHVRRFSRRRFLGGLTLAGAAGLLGLHPSPVAAEPPPETTTLRLGQTAALCLGAPQYVAETLFHAEGFSDVHYGPGLQGAAYMKALATGETHFGISFAGQHLVQIDAGDPIMLIAGLHVGCYELFGTDRVRTIRDLRGKTVAVTTLGSGRHVFLASMLAHVGLDIRKDVNLVTYPSTEEIRLLAEGKIDAFMAFPPESQELRAKKIGHVVVNTAIDRPWLQYFCCMIAGNRDFVRNHPVATKRALLAILKAVDVCALAPDRAVQSLVEKGVSTHYDYALQAMQEIPWDKWRDYDPEDTVRFYALRLHEAGMIKSSPQKIIAQGTDWRFFNALKKELKG
jgi:NitT/TauT family transport system substrate-binding protein